MEPVGRGLTLVPAAELYRRAERPFDVRRRDGISYSVLRSRRPFPIPPPLVQAGSVACAAIPHHEYSEVAIFYIPNAIVTQTGVVVYDNKFILEETVEGGLQENGFVPRGNVFDLAVQPESVDEDIININRYGTFNYSIFLSEVLPLAAVAGAVPGLDDLRAGIHFADFMPPHHVAARLELLALFGFPAERVTRRTPGSMRYRGVVVVKVNDRPAKSHRISQLTPMIAGALKSCLNDSAAPTHRRIYISRQKSMFRKMTNFASIEENILRRHDFTVLQLDDMKLSAQINSFARADVVLAEHGAGLVNCMFMRPGAIMLEVFPQPMVGRWMYRMVAAAFGLHYFFGSMATPADWQWNRDDITADEALYRLLVERI